MDGFTAAELIQSVRPQARVILHTSIGNPVKEVKARELGLTLLVKGDFDSTIEAVTARLEVVRESEEPLEAGLETLILSAFAGRAAEAVVVINAEQSVSFYSQAAARLLDLPLPVQRMTLAELRRHHPLFDLEAAEPDRNPIAAAVQRKQPAVAELVDTLPDGVLRTYRVQAMPVFDAGRYLGLVSYMTVLREQQPSL